MRISREVFNKLKPINNYVLIKLDKTEGDKGFGYENVKTIEGPNGDIQLELDTSYDPNWMLTVSGTIEKVCESLYFNDCERMADKGMPWLTDIEVQPGDKVLYEYMAISEAIGTVNQKSFGRLILCEDDAYIFVHYMFLYLAIRDEQVIPLNGYCFGVHATEKLTEHKAFELNQGMSNIIMEDELTILYEGSVNRAYKNRTLKSIVQKELIAIPDYDSNLDESLVGKNVVVTKKNFIFKVENDINNILEDGLSGVQRRYIACRI